jgi:septal ring factor EnvC (AmiA/AmiB activator)
LVFPRTRKPDIAGDENHQLRPNIPSRQDAANSERSKNEMDARAKAKAKANRSKRRGDSDKVGRHSSSGMRIGSELRAIYGCG